MKVAHVVKRIEMIDDDIRQLKKLENQLKKGKRYATPIALSIEKQINILLAERIKYLELKIENPPELAEWEEEEEVKTNVKPVAEKVSRIRTRKKEPLVPSSKGKTESAKPSRLKELPSTSQIQEDNDADLEDSIEDGTEDSLMLTQEMIDKKFEEARKRLQDDGAGEKKKTIGGIY